jgi:hypothetical protein
MLSAFTSRFNDAEPPRANHQLTRLPAGRCKPEPAPGMRKCIPSAMPFGKLSRWPASTLVRFAVRDPIDGIGMCCGAIKKPSHCHQCTRFVLKSQGDH